MRTLRRTACAAIISALLSACSSQSSAPLVASNASVKTGLFAHVSVMDPLAPQKGMASPPLHLSGPTVLHGIEAPDTAKAGIYVAEIASKSMFGYAMNKRKEKKGPLCTVPWSVATPQDIAVDGKGALIEPDGSNDLSSPIRIGTGPGMCGALSSTVTDGAGWALDAASNDAQNGIIVVASQFNNPFPTAGSLSVCTIAGGCTVSLTNPAMYRVAGVALDPNGNCWASALDGPSGNGTLTYFANCSGPGVAATGYQNTGYGGMDIDKSGNLVTIDYSIPSRSSVIYVYSGCNPACTVVGGPFTMQGPAIYGHLNKDSTRLIVADPEYGQVDIYRYSPTSITYLYSFNTGLTKNDDVEGAAVNPRSVE